MNKDERKHKMEQEYWKKNKHPNCIFYEQHTHNKASDFLAQNFDFRFPAPKQRTVRMQVYFLFYSGIG